MFVGSGYRAGAFEVEAALPVVVASCHSAMLIGVSNSALASTRTLESEVPLATSTRW